MVYECGCRFIAHGGAFYTLCVQDVETGFLAVRVVSAECCCCVTILDIERVFIRDAVLFSKDETYFLHIVVEVLLQERDDFICQCFEYLNALVCGRGFYVVEVGVAYLAVLAKEGADSVIYRMKNVFGFLTPQHTVVRQIFLELEAAAEGWLVGLSEGRECRALAADSPYRFVLKVRRSRYNHTFYRID